MPTIPHLIVTQLQMIEEEPPTMGVQLLTGHYYKGKQPNINAIRYIRN